MRSVHGDLLGTRLLPYAREHFKSPVNCISNAQGDIPTVCRSNNVGGMPGVGLSYARAA